jgi:hypothetical protein
MSVVSCCPRPFRNRRDHHRPHVIVFHDFQRVASRFAESRDHPHPGFGDFPGDEVAAVVVGGDVDVVVPVARSLESQLSQARLSCH